MKLSKRNFWEGNRIFFLRRPPPRQETAQDQSLLPHLMMSPSLFKQNKVQIPCLYINNTCFTLSPMFPSFSYNPKSWSKFFQALGKQVISVYSDTQKDLRISFRLMLTMVWWFICYNWRLHLPRFSEVFDMAVHWTFSWRTWLLQFPQ